MQHRAAALRQLEVQIQPDHVRSVNPHHCAKAYMHARTHATAHKLIRRIPRLVTLLYHLIFHPMPHEHHTPGRIRPQRPEFFEPP
jgi:hypothetical protein